MSQVVIMDWNTFKERTKRTLKTGFVANAKNKFRGKEMSKVDFALQEYEKVGTMNVRKQIETVQFLVNACLEWLRLKKTKIEVAIDENTEIQQETVRVLRRKIAVTIVANQALKELYRLLIANNMLTVDRLGRIKFEINKTNKSLNINHAAQAVLPKRSDSPRRTPPQVVPLNNSHRNQPLKPMDPAYALERRTFLESKKNRAVSGSGAHDLHHALHDDSNHIRRRNENISEQDWPRVQQALINLRDRDVNNLTIDDFRIVEEVGHHVTMATANNYVAYLRKNQRFDFIAMIDQDGLLVDANYTHIHCGYDIGQIEENKNELMYAMDKYGNLFVHTGKRITGFSHFNHSSFNAGHDVICAGCLRVDRGLLKVIDNNSGHYKPGRRNLHNCVIALRDEGVNLKYTKVRLSAFAGVDGETHTRMYEFSAQDFLMNMNTPSFRTL